MSYVFSLWRFVFMVGWAKSLTWEITTDKERRTLFFSIHKVTEIETDYTGYGLILGAITFMCGYAPQK